jgi:hypothetical protein
MPTQEYLGLNVNGRKYRIGQIRANVGSLLIRRIIGASGGDQRKALSMVMGGMPLEDEVLLQRHLLAVVEFHREIGADEAWLPVFDGERVLDPNLTHDSVSLWALQQASFDYNVAPFFIERGQKALTAILTQVPRSAPSNSETLTAS